MRTQCHSVLAPDIDRMPLIVRLRVAAADRSGRFFPNAGANFTSNFTRTNP